MCSGGIDIFSLILDMVKLNGDIVITSSGGLAKLYCGMVIVDVHQLDKTKL